MEAYQANEGLEAAQRVAALLASAEAQLAEVQQELARGTLEIACALARQVLRQEIATRPAVLEPVVREALAMLAVDGKASAVRLSPTDFERLGVALRAEFEGQPVSVVADAGIAPGDCLVESAGTVIDGGVATRWSR
ncbi:flagellar assembly protein FliH, partial [Variovorax sp. CT11-76]